MSTVIGSRLVGLAGWAAAAARRALGVEAAGGPAAVATATAVLAPGLVLLLVHVGTGLLSTGWILLAAVAGWASVRWADTVVPLLGWLSLLALWALAAPQPAWLAVPAAVVLLLGHSATAWLAGAPDDVRAEPALRRRWVGRLVAVAAVTVAVGALAPVAARLAAGGSVVLTTVVLVALAGWLRLVSRTRD